MLLPTSSVALAIQREFHSPAEAHFSNYPSTLITRSAAPPSEVSDQLVHIQLERSSKMTDSDHFQQSSVNHEQAAKDLHAACVANDLRRVRELLNTKFLGADDATHELKGTRRDTSLMRCLLEHGADPNSLHIRSNCSPDVLRLLAKFGYDIQAQGHLILQCVSRPIPLQ